MILKRSAVILVLSAMTLMFAAAFMTHPARAGTHDATAQAQVAPAFDVAATIATINRVGLGLLAILSSLALLALPKANYFDRQSKTRSPLLLRFWQLFSRPPDYALKL